MKYASFCVLLLFGCLAAPPARAQRPTSHGPVPPQDQITLTKNTPFDQALRVIRAISNQMIVDPQHLTKPIGVDIDRQGWLWALVQIAKQNGLQVVEHQDYYELASDPADKKADPDSAPDGATLDTQEVNISAIFFQADRTAIRDLGVDWTTLSSGRVDVQASQFGAQAVAGNPFSLAVRGQAGKTMSVDALLKTLETNNEGEVVANPQIKVESGKKGYIQVGSDFSVTTSDFAGNAITQFFSTGTILTVSPTVFSQEGVNFVALDVQAERSSLVDPVRKLVSKTVARTSALLKDGEQTAIGGLYGHVISSTREGIPVLKNIPGWFFGLGYLFGHTAKQVTKTELVVLLKVNVVPSLREQMGKRLHSMDAGEIVEQRRKAFEEVLKHFQKVEGDQEVQKGP